MQINSHSLHQIRLAGLLVDALPTAMVVTDSQGTIALVNNRAESSFGYREAELCGRSILTLIPDLDECDYTSHKTCRMSPSRAPSLPEWKRAQGKRKNGSLFPIRLKMRRIPTESNELILTHVSGLPPNDPENEFAVQAERLTAVREMISGLAHETNSALQRARACLELLEMDLPQDSQSLNLTAGISEALNDLRQNYEDVKSYASPITLNRSLDINLGQLCQTVFDELTESSSAMHSLVIHSEALCDRVKLDVAKIKRVLSALLENAIQASPNGAVIEITCREIKVPGTDATEISVRDHGTGFSESIADHLFAPFFSTKPRGTGLGLAVCRRIAEAHSGTVSAINHPDGGVLVRVVIPREQ